VAKVLFLSLPLAGHVHPSLPLVHDPTDRDDEVELRATASMASISKVSPAPREVDVFSH
jgi:hypothetical protein